MMPRADLIASVRSAKTAAEATISDEDVALHETAETPAGHKAQTPLHRLVVDLLRNKLYNKLYNKSTTNRSNGVWA